MTAVPQPAGHGPGLYAGDQSHGGEQGDDRRSSGTDEGEGEAHDGQDIEAHAHVEGDLAEEHPGHSHADVGGKGGTGVTAYPDAPQDNGGKQQQQGHTAHQS